MAWGFVAGAAISVVGGAVASNSAKKSANAAANAQTESAELGVQESRRQFDAMQQLMNPYVQAGNGALTGQQNLIGLNGSDAQAQAIAGIQNGPQYAAIMQAGSDQILGNASATGGLRGGNTQAALGQFGGQMVNQLIQQQYQNLGGLTSVGQNAAAGVGNAGMQTGQNISNLYQQQGAAQAGAQIANGQANAQMINGFANTAGNMLGAYYGGKGF